MLSLFHFLPFPQSGFSSLPTDSMRDQSVFQEISLLLTIAIVLTLTPLHGDDAWRNQRKADVEKPDSLENTEYSSLANHHCLGLFLSLFSNSVFKSSKFNSLSYSDGNFVNGTLSTESRAVWINGFSYMKIGHILSPFIRYVIWIWDVLCDC